MDILLIDTEGTIKNFNNKKKSDNNHTIILLFHILNILNINRFWWYG